MRAISSIRRSGSVLIIRPPLHSNDACTGPAVFILQRLQSSPRSPEKIMVRKSFTIGASHRVSSRRSSSRKAATSSSGVAP